MQCPEDGAVLQETESHGVKIHECPTCLGRWFGRDELRRAKDRTDPDLRWLDFDPFVGEAEERASGSTERLCPQDMTPLGVMAYEASGVSVDECSKCHGVWLSHGEFEKIVRHLEKIVNTETAAQYEAEAVRQFAQIFTGPEGPASEARDLLSVLHLLKTRLAAEHPGLSGAIDAISLGSPFK